MAEITKEIVEKIAHLSNIQIKDEEAQLYAGQLETILGYIHKLSELDTKDVPQTAHALPIQNIWREDQVEPGLSQEQAIASAPEPENGCFRVPRIIE